MGRGGPRPLKPGIFYPKIPRADFFRKQKALDLTGFISTPRFAGTVPGGLGRGSSPRPFFWKGELGVSRGERFDADQPPDAQPGAGAGLVGTGEKRRDQKKTKTSPLPFNRAVYPHPTHGRGRQEQSFKRRDRGSKKVSGGTGTSSGVTLLRGPAGLRRGLGDVARQGICYGRAAAGVRGAEKGGGGRSGGLVGRLARRCSRATDDREGKREVGGCFAGPICWGALGHAGAQGAGMDVLFVR